jgi:DNA repair protein RadD
MSYKTPYWYQKAALKAIFSHDFGTGHALVVHPTGSGKAVVIGCFCEKVIKNRPNQKILVLSDNQEILEQDHQTIKDQLPGMEIGLYSAGLGIRNILQLTVASIQSIFNIGERFTDLDLILVDEAHKVPYKRQGRYHIFFNAVRKPILGFTATPFRLECGLLTSGPNPFFKHIIHEVTADELVKDKKLCPFTTKETKAVMNASKIKKIGREYSISALSLKFDRPAITNLILDELATYYPGRNKMLVYGIDIDHANHIAEGLNERKIVAEVLHTKTKNQRTEIIENFKNGFSSALVSVAMLTTGVNIPSVDMIALLRPTASMSLLWQIIGRGGRIAPGKRNCLVLDFGGSLLKLGPMYDPSTKKRREIKTKNDPVMKACPECLELLFIAVSQCPECGYKFRFKHGLSLKPVDLKEVSMRNWFQVSEVFYRLQSSRQGGFPMLVAEYICGRRTFKDFICLEHYHNFGRRMAEKWWKKRWSERPFVPDTVKKGLQCARFLKTPKRIQVDLSKKYPEIKKYEF